MAVKIAEFPASVLPYKIIYDPAFGSAPIVDITNGAGTLYSINLDNTLAANAYYVKLWLSTASFTLGTSNPEAMFKVAAQQDLVIQLPGGLPFSALSVVIVDSAKDATASGVSSTSHTTSSNPGAIKVTLVTS
jgi:hypothetical protein|tara:strand:- start:1821 stop:2219 length:399 start_codon:yes stop_codon:yes gene_type:complete